MKDGQEYPATSGLLELVELGETKVNLVRKVRKGTLVKA
jgi:hypothetical protein